MDKLGMIASIACAVHCALLPLVFTFLPLIGMEFLANKWIETGMISLSIVLGTWSLATAYRSHKSVIPLIVLVFGFALIGSGHFFFENLESVVIPMGGISIAAAHYINWTLHRPTCNETCCDDSGNVDLN